MADYPTWKVSPLKVEDVRTTGGLLVFHSGRSRFPIGLEPATAVLLFNPETALAGLKLMRENLQQMRFASPDPREELEQAQLRLDELIRMYENLV